MNLSVEEIKQTIEIDDKDLDDFCISLSVDIDSDTINKEKLIQKAIDNICSTFYRQTLFADYELQVSKPEVIIKEAIKTFYSLQK